MKRQFLITLGTMFFAANLPAQVFTYAFSDVVSGTSSTSAGGSAGHLTFSTFSANGVGATSNAGGVFSFTGWSTGATNASSVFSGGLDATDYFQFTITPDAGFAFTLTSLTFSAGRSATGPRQVSLRSSADDFVANLPVATTNANAGVVATNIIQFTDNATTATYTGNSAMLTGADFTNQSGPLTFRIYGFNAESAAGTLRLDDFGINGSVSTISAVPEPATYGAWVGGLVLGRAIWRRRRRRAQA
jgi:hypothetical protein